MTLEVPLVARRLRGLRAPGANELADRYADRAWGIANSDARTAGVLGMSDDLTIIERAFELARSGAVADMSELRAKLKLERRESIEAHLSSSPSLNRQLTELVREAKQRAKAAGLISPET